MKQAREILNLIEEADPDDTDTHQFPKLLDEWFVWEMGQDPLHMLWRGVFVDFADTKRNVQLEEYRSPQLLVEAANRVIKALNENPLAPDPVLDDHERSQP